MRVLMLHNRYLVPGGEDQSAAAECALLRDAGHEVELLEKDNRVIEQTGKVRTAARTVWSRESYREISDKLSDGRFDVLHVQNFFPLWSPAVYYAAHRRGVPVVQTLRNYRLMCVNATLYRDGQVCEDCVGKALPWPGVLHGCYRNSRGGSAVVATMLGWHRARRTWAKQVDVYIALTEFAREKYIRAGLPEQKIAVKANFVHPSPAPGPGGGGYAIFIGRLSAEKGIATLLRAWKSMDCPLPLKIVGDGPLQAEVTSASASDRRIEFLGRKSAEETFEFLQRAEFLVFPSEWYEGMPRVVIESFAAGTPVLAANIGATAAMVANGENGFHFPPGNAAALARVVEQCGRDLGAVRRMRAAAREEFERKYTGAANLQALLSIYQDAQQSFSGEAAATQGSGQ